MFNLLHSFCKNGAPSRNKAPSLKQEERRIKIEWCLVEEQAASPTPVGSRQTNLQEAADDFG
jgi:hypothetical protein